MERRPLLLRTPWRSRTGTLGGIATVLNLGAIAVAAAAFAAAFMWWRHGAKGPTS